MPEMQPGSHESLFSGAGPAVPHSARERRQPYARPETKTEKEARQREQVLSARHFQLQEERDVMAQQALERRERLLKIRDNKFEALVSGILDGVGLKAEIEDVIRVHEATLRGKQHELYNRWDSDVMQRTEHRISKHMSKEPFVAAEGVQARLRSSDDPLKSDQRAQEAERSFHRAAGLVLNTSVAREDARQGKQDQRVYNPSRQAFFHQACQAQDDGLGFFTHRRMGPDVHKLDESDGISAAGKTKHRFERNLLGVLEGSLSRDGQSSRFKTDFGGSSGAPCQDHYHFERGLAVLEAEIPLGKRMVLDACRR